LGGWLTKEPPVCGPITGTPCCTMPGSNASIDGVVRGSSNASSASSAGCAVRATSWLNRPVADAGNLRLQPRRIAADST